MTRELVTCQCPRWPDARPCERLATAEDFQCDPCRDAANGTGAACSRFRIGGFAPGAAGAVLAHVEIQEGPYVWGGGK